ncbi:hypothetical protein F4810DRAFT_706217 [Camillea tinctor]|nr:hypothetical protein F4810DRAFT_706217 [Camillea tinctor]
MPTPNLPQSPNELYNTRHLHSHNTPPPPLPPLLSSLRQSLDADASITANANAITNTDTDVAIGLSPSLSHSHTLSNQHCTRDPPATSVALIDPTASRPQFVLPDAGLHLRLRGGGLDTSDSPESQSGGTVVRIGENESEQHIPRSSPGARRKGKEVSIAQDPPEIMGSQQTLEEYRLRLARDMERRELSGRSLQSATGTLKLGASPLREESTLSPTPDSDVPTASTESNKTIRGGVTPGFVARTPSYPFPRMGTPGFQPSLFQNAFGQQHFSNIVLHDQLRSDPSSPASAMTFLPGATPYSADCDYPAPNLYDLTLMLTAEPGLNAWWNTVIQIMTDYYKAERITLSVPADSTDIDNVPWGQKATYNAQEEDDLSMGYIARDSSLMANSGDGLSEYSSNVDLTQKSEKPTRPGIQSRHSFTAYEDKKESRKGHVGESIGPQRPVMLSRSKSYYPGTGRRTPMSPHPLLNEQALEEHDAVEDQQAVPVWEATLESNSEPKGRVHPVLQGLELEADPLIDHNGITRVVERGKVVALTRSYPYLDRETEGQQQTPKRSGNASAQDANKHQRTQTRSESTSKLSSLLANASTARPVGQKKKSPSLDKSKIPSLLSAIDNAPPRPPTPKYEEYEQTPPSPWSQSPAPSPAVRPDPLENPFFTDAVVDEESFNPGPSPQDYSSAQPPETIGVDNSWTVLHIPLNHILLSKPAQRFKLDPAALANKTGQRGKAETTTPERRSSTDSTEKSRQPPLAILSILSPVIPYPSSLRHSLENLAPHLATSFSLCRHYTNLETESLGLHRRRPSTAGFGAVAPDGRPLANSATLNRLNYTPSEGMSQRSITESLTSPSDYSGPSRSITASPMGTPMWEPASFGLIVDRRPAGTSPNQIGGDGYFNSRPRNGGVSNSETLSNASTHRPIRISKDSSSAASKLHKRSGSLRYHIQESTQGQRESGAPELILENAATTEEGHVPSSKQRPSSKDLVGEEGEIDEQPQRDTNDAHNLLSSEDGHKHTRLHSYGGDFATTLQSLPPSTPLLSKPTTQSSIPSRPGSAPGPQVSMLPPTDRLKGLMLDLLPVHVFVALPLNGEIVWVNSRYLSYRGQTLDDLVANPWGTLHPEDRDDYLRAWTTSLRTGEQFAHTVRIRRFDGAYRWHQARAVASRDKRGVIVQFIGSYMDIHDQKVAELLALRQQEIEASEAKHRLLANLIPQIIFTATESDGITFANEQWLSYTGQSIESPLGLGFMDFVHPDDMAKCRFPEDRISRAFLTGKNSLDTPSEFSSIGQKPLARNIPAPATSTQGSNTMPALLSRYNSTENNSVNDFPNTDLNELVKKGIIKVTTDSNGRLSYTTELRLRSKSGEYRWHLIRCVQIDDVGFGSGASSYFGSATDINDHKLLEAKLKEAMESKSRFLSNMSHEIRTPLIGISGMVSFLQDTILNEEQRDYTNTIQTSANSLLMIINDILDLSKVDAGMMKLNFEWFHTRSLIEDVNELVSTMAIAKRLELNYIVEENVPSWVKGDKVRIRQVLLNVIGNAIKFTAEGEVFSRCRVFSDKASQLGEHQIMLEFSVIDTGRGFTKEEAELIFKPFSQIDGSSTRQHGGSGLGLVISRQLVELHGGTMEGTAVLGKGSTFTFTTRLGLPSSTDYPSIAGTPPMVASLRGSVDDRAMQAIKPYLLHRTVDQPPAASPNSEGGVMSPAPESSASSDPSIRSVRSQTTARSSVSSVNVGLVHFSEAAKASGQDLSQMKLEMPSGTLSPQITPTPDGIRFPPSLDQFRPPMYSILIICPQRYSREATTKHIETTLPKDIPHQITAMASVSEAEGLIGGHESVTFTHIVLNLSSAEEIISVIDRIMTSSGGKPSVLVLSDSVQRQSVLRLASDPGHQQLIEEKRIIFVYKPVKPSRFAVIFDPGRERDLSIDLNRSNAAQMVENQKQNYIDVEKRIGNKGYKVLLVEDNTVNQKVLVRYLKKVGIETEIAADGVEATEMVFARPARYYSLILCDLHMPRKDGYQACREIRQWEQENNYSQTPIIALSANVMSDVQEKCVAAGFNDYVTKPVDFMDLSTAMSKYF